MKLLVATDAHIYQTPDGKHWCTAIYFYSFWQRYLNIFDSVRIVARVKKVPKKEEKYKLVDGDGVEIFPIPFYQGPKQLAMKYISIQCALKNVANGCDVAIFRMPSQTAQMTYRHIKKNMPIGGEIVYDPTDDINNKKNPIIIRMLDKRISHNLKNFCKAANGVSYVTKKTIQENYPSYSRIHGEDTEHFETYYSTITLSDDAFCQPREYKNLKKLRIVHSNVSMNSERKGEKTVIYALKEIRNRGVDASVTFIGDGSMRKTFEESAKKLGVEEYVDFLGLLPSPAEVRNVLNHSDIFVFPSQAEGLPRGIIESMAVGLPVLSTPVGGIPELIDEKYLFDPLDYMAFSDMLVHLFNNPEELEEMSGKNYNNSLQFKNSILQCKRDEFYKRLCNLK